MKFQYRQGQKPFRWNLSKPIDSEKATPEAIHEILEMQKLIFLYRKMIFVLVFLQNEKVSSEEQKQKAKLFDNGFRNFRISKCTHRTGLFSFSRRSRCFSLLEEFPKKNIRVAFVFQNRKNDCEMDRNTNTSLREDMVFPLPRFCSRNSKIRFDCVFVPAIAVNEKQDTTV